MMACRSVGKANEARTEILKATKCAPSKVNFKSNYMHEWFTFKQKKCCVQAAYFETTYMSKCAIIFCCIGYCASSGLVQFYVGAKLRRG